MTKWALALSILVTVNAFGMDFRVTKVAWEGLGKDKGNWGELHPAGQHTRAYAERFLPMNEQILDSLSGLDRTKIYTCEVKTFFTAMGLDHVFALYDIRNCQEN